MSDLIDRQQALEKVRAMQTYKLSEGDDMLLLDKAEVQTELMMLPPVQPEVLACGNGELIAKFEPTDIDAKEAVYNLAEKIGIHQLFALTVELRGEPIQPEQQEGYWKKDETDDCPPVFRQFRICSVCGAIETSETNYCPHCGAKMINK